MIDGNPLSGSQGVIVVSNDDAAAEVAVRNIAQAGARHLATVDWQAAPARIASQATPAVILIETTGISASVAAEQLPGLVAAAGRDRAIIDFSFPLLEQISGAVIDTAAISLCDARPEDRLVALVLATTPRNLALHDSSGEAARLARINQEVARFTETLARLTGAAPDPITLPGAQPMLRDRQPAIDISSGDDVAPTAADVRRAIRARRLRDETFGLAGLFEDPAWDMMLDLFAAELERQQVSVSSLCIAAAVAPTTALRWINKLIEVGLFERRPDELDRRRAYVALTARASATMRSYVAALARSGLSIA